MKTSIVKLILAVILLTVTAADASAQDAQLVDETSPRITRSQRLQIKRLNEGLNAKLKLRLQRNPRYREYAAEASEISRIKDEAEQKRRVEELQKKYADLRDEILKVAGTSVRSYNRRLKQILPRIQLDDSGMIVNRKPLRNIRSSSSTDVLAKTGFQNAEYNFSPNADTTLEITEFPDTWSFKDCRQGTVTFDSSTEFSTRAQTDLSEEDCNDVKAARGAVVNVPAGTRTVRVEITVDKSFISGFAAPWGYIAYASAYSAVGIRVVGFIVGSSKRVNYFRHDFIDIYWSVLGADDATVEETNATYRCTFKPLVPGEFRIQAYGRSTADTDGLAVANSASSVEGMKKIKITFVR